ncbi:cytochrome P450 [Talaromyces proteolyticus]|uniref:Cytochrome P450 n=1 Tax=Talaromyces proteolyticus TaxID=1131652 RepID=A0AAD4PT78_9EURO|nr:cytochrome P450 [Talaromyces proteolyticus]KAH8690309.1 cytochrome P450 [Talaromyces proteolyticus]
MLGPVFLTGVALSLISYFIIYPVVEYFRDPKGLRKYPNLNGLSGMTNLSFIWEAYKGFRSNRLLEAHQKYPVVRIGPNSLSYGDPKAIKDIYGHGTSCVKDQFYSVLVGSHYHLADVVDKPDHARKRKILSSAYALKNLEGWEHKVADKAERLVHAFDTRCTAPITKKTNNNPAPEDLTVDYRAWTNFFTLDAIADIGLSERLGFLDAGNDSCTGERMDGTLYTIPSYRACLHATARAQSNLVWGYDWYPFLVEMSKVISTKFREYWRLNEGWNDIVWHRACKRLRRYQAGEVLDDFFACLMEDKSGNMNNMEFGEIVAEVSIMMNAGSDTTALAMTNAMFLLLRNPKCLAKLREELDTVLDSEDVVAPYDKIRYLPYLRACLDEALRILPPTSFGLPRRTPRDGSVIGEEFVAGDTTVSISAYVAHRNPKLFPDPESFQPERWIGEKGKELQPYFISFSAGARGCIGRNISYLEQSVVLATVVHRYEMALAKPDWEPERWESFNLMSSAMPVKIWRRTFETANE